MPNDPLARYHFADDHGHPRENCIEYRDLLVENERLRSEVTRLNKESDWLVKMLSLYTEDCPLKFSWVYAEKLPIPKIDDCEGTWSVDDCIHCAGRNPGQCWREAARKAVEEEERHG